MKGESMATRDRRETQEMARRPSSGGSFATRDQFGSSDPFSQFRRLTEQMDRWFDSIAFGRANPRRAAGGDSAWGAFWAPELETFRRGDEIVVRIDLPGLKPEDVNVEVTDDNVVISGERQQSQEEEREGWYRSERSYGRFYREIPLPEGAQPDTTRADFRDGVLEISVKAPPREVTQPRRVEIGASSTSDRSERKMPGAAAGTSMPPGDRSTQPERPSVAHERRSKDS